MSLGAGSGSTAFNNFFINVFISWFFCLKKNAVFLFKTPCIIRLGEGMRKSNGAVVGGAFFSAYLECKSY